jgi:hypothetical protein
MNTNSERKRLLEPIIFIGITLVVCAFIPLGGVAALRHFRVAYILPTLFAIVAFTTVIILPIHQKRLSLFLLSLSIIGLFYFASSSVQLGYNVFIENLPPHTPENFRLYAFADLLAGNLERMGLGLLMFSAAIGRIGDYKKLPKVMILLLCGVGAFGLISGAYQIFQLFQKVHLI